MSDAGNDAALPDGVQAAVLDDRSSLDTAFSRDDSSPETRFSIGYVGTVIRQLRKFGIPGIAGIASSVSFSHT